MQPLQKKKTLLLLQLSLQSLYLNLKEIRSFYIHFYETIKLELNH